jgi:hypothetical protein
LLVDDVQAETPATKSKYFFIIAVVNVRTHSMTLPFPMDGGGLRLVFFKSLFKFYVLKIRMVYCFKPVDATSAKKDDWLLFWALLFYRNSMFLSWFSRVSFLLSSFLAASIILSLSWFSSSWKNIVFRLYTSVSTPQDPKFSSIFWQVLSGYMSPSTWLKVMVSMALYLQKWDWFYYLHSCAFNKFFCFISHKIHYFCVIYLPCSFPSWNLPYKFWPFTWFIAGAQYVSLRREMYYLDF